MLLFILARGAALIVRLLATLALAVVLAIVLATGPLTTKVSSQAPIAPNPGTKYTTLNGRSW